jgi:hypothetical protein
MACMTLPWAPVATLINSLPLAGSGPSQRLQNRCPSRPGWDHGSSGTGGPRRRRTAAAPARGL